MKIELNPYEYRSLLVMIELRLHECDARIHDNPRYYREEKRFAQAILAKMERDQTPSEDL